MERVLAGTTGLVLSQMVRKCKPLGARVDIAV